MYLWKDGSSLKEEGRYIYDGAGSGWRVVPMCEKKDSGSPFQCYFPADLMYRIAKDSSVGTKPTLPDMQFFVASRKNNANSVVNFTKGTGITSASHASWGTLYIDSGDWAGQNFFIGVSGTSGDLLSQRTRNEKKISIGYFENTGGKIPDASTNFSPVGARIVCSRVQGSTSTIVNTRRYCYSFAMAINFSANFQMSNFASMQIIVPCEPGNNRSVTSSLNLRKLAGLDAATTFVIKRAVSSGSTSDTSTSDAHFYLDAKPATYWNGTDTYGETYIIRGMIYSKNYNTCKTDGESFWYTPWIRFKANDLVFRKTQTTGTISINYAECYEGWMDIVST